MVELKKDWTLKPEAFRQLLSWLDGGSDSGGEAYVEVRRLSSYFERKNCLSCDELADETLNRIARKLEEKGSITDVSALHYCYIVAKFVFLESLRQTKLVQAGTTELQSSDSETTPFSRSIGDCARRAARENPWLAREVFEKSDQGGEGADSRILPWPAADKDRAPFGIGRPPRSQQKRVEHSSRPDSQ